MTLEINEFTDVLDVLSQLTSQHGLNDLWWRGQSNYNWELVPDVYRGTHPNEYEGNLILRFQAEAPIRHNSCPDKENRIGWLLLAQHYGLPTRLLDWTESLLIGLYFAVEDEKYFDSNGGLFCLLPALLNKNERGACGHLPAHDPWVGKITWDAFRHDKKGPKDILSLVPDQVDIRHMTQQTAFTIHGRSDPLKNGESPSPFIFKYKIKKESKGEIKEILRGLGIKKSYLFPDLDHLAADIKELKFTTPDTEGQDKKDAEPEVSQKDGGQ